MQILLTRTSTPLGAAIRYRTNSDVNHAAVLVNGTVYEADARWCEFVKPERGVGVFATSIEQWVCDKEVLYVRTIEADDEMIETWLKKQVGKKYDYKKVLMYLTLRNEVFVPNYGYWDCFDLAHATINKADGKTEIIQYPSGETIKARTIC